MATDDKVSVIVTSTDTSGAVKQKSFTYISPDATNSELKAFAQAANALTENTYNGSKKVTQIDLDTATDKQTPTLTLSQSSCTFSQLGVSNGGTVQITLTTDSDGDIYIKYNGADGMAPIAISPTATQGSYYVNIFKVVYGGSTEATAASQTLTFGVMETNTYKAAEVTFSITE